MDWRMCRRLSPESFGPVPVGKKTFVPTSMSPRTPRFSIQAPTIRSDSPRL